MNREIRDYRYTHSTTSIIKMIVVVWIFPLATYWGASRNPQGKSVLGGLVHLPQGALWALCGLTVFLAVLCTVFAVRRLRGPSFVQLAGEHVEIPKASILGGWLSVPYEDVTGVEIRPAPNNDKMIVVNTKAGQSRLMLSAFDGSTQFLAFFAELQERMEGVCQTSSASARPAQHTAPAPSSAPEVPTQSQGTDPLAGAKRGAQEVVQALVGKLNTGNGVHVESLLCALGSLAGYACQARLRAQALEKGTPENKVFVIVETTNGGKYYFGDPLNKALAESKYSVWGLAAGAAQHHGCADLPDVAEIFGHVSKTVGNADFGHPRLPERHQPALKPVSYVQAYWAALLPTVKRCCPKPSEWPILYGIAIQQVMGMSKQILPADMALRIVMESAVPMSKIDLESYR
ncbi:MAG: hypothetical protein REI94_14890 [Moraxellaceae bacterium]|nr:hypothetical protein [Moraxellaceae bacterium]